MSVDEIVACMAARRGITHRDDIAHLRDDVTEAIELYEQPHRWIDDGKPAANASASTT